METKGVSAILSALDCLTMNKQMAYIERERVEHDARGMAAGELEREYM